MCTSTKNSKRVDKKFPVDQILSLVNTEKDFDFLGVDYRKVTRDILKQRLLVGGHNVRVSTLRLQTFREKGIACTHCGLTGSYFVVEKDNNGYHLSLYGVNDIGQEILMTMDHIKPVSKGGPNHLDNLQTLCKPCNLRKDNTYIDKETEVK